jgi:N-terminal acetyltransferase B complex non-catalytic subunit
VQELFLAHVRLGNVLEQQQLAMKISKAAPGELQTFWVVCSMLTQADRARFGAGTGMSQDMLLKLAAGLISKHLQREEVMSYEGVLVYLDILLAQGSFEECMELLEGPCARAVRIPHELLRLKVCFHHQHCCPQCPAT